MSTIRGFSVRVRRPEYTGENRCLPCTFVNVLLAGAVAAAIAARWSTLAGAASLVICLLAIHLRGYLVPGTPALTQRVLPERVLEAFGKERVKTSAVAQGDSRPVPSDVEPLLRRTGVAVRDGESEAEADERRGDGTTETPRYRLSAEFAETWRERIEALRADGGVTGESGETAVARVFGSDRDAVSAVGNVGFVVDGSRLARWDSEAALLADAAAVDELRTWVEEWETMDANERRELLTALRVLLTRCPACDGPLSAVEERVDHCCQPSFDTVTVECERCGATTAATVL